MQLWQYCRCTDDFSDYLRSTGIRKDSDILTHHCARPNKDRDIEIYRRTIELWNDGHKRLNYNDLPDELKTHKNRKSFLDRFKVYIFYTYMAYKYLAQ